MVMYPLKSRENVDRSRQALLLGAMAALALGFTAPSTGDSLGPMPAVGVEGGPRNPLAGDTKERWLHGRELFAREFTASEGLGPLSNAPSCGSCHNQPVLGGAGGLEHNVGGDEVLGALESYSLRGAPTGRGSSVQASNARSRRRAMAFCPDDEPSEPRPIGIQTPSLLGLSMIETIPDHVLLELEDPADQDRDGIRGVAPRISMPEGRVELGRFGWRSQAPSLDDFVRGACAGELGMTVPWNEREFGVFEDGDGRVDPELTRHDLLNLTIYCAELAAPSRTRGENPAQARRGEQLFESTGCAACHVPVLYGTEGPVMLYSDLLTHHVVERRPLSDEERRVLAFIPRVAGEKREGGRSTEGDLPGPERFRTPPLWGIARTAPYLHDGRAATLSAAIEGHALEASGSRERWRGLEDAERDDLLAFLAEL